MHPDDASSRSLFLLIFPDVYQCLFDIFHRFGHRRGQKGGHPFLNEGFRHRVEGAFLPIHHIGPVRSMDVLIDKTRSHVDAFWQGN